jgi:[acyl-carrier-protein] S-malonyltransferase
MAPARERFGRLAERVPFAPPVIPMLLNTTGLPSVDPAEIRERVVESLSAPVRWREAMATLRTSGVAAVLEVGPGRVLSGLARQNELPAATTILPVGSLRGVETAAASV